MKLLFGSLALQKLNSAGPTFLQPFPHTSAELVVARFERRQIHLLYNDKCSLKLNHRPVNIESPVCVVKDVVKCSFEYFCVVHHDTCRLSI